MKRNDTKRKVSPRAQTASRNNRARRRRITVISDGSAGNEAQALALAEALVRAYPASIDVLTAQTAGWVATMPASVIHWLGLGLTGVHLSDTPQPSDLLIGAGRRSAPVVAALARRMDIAAIQLMAPQMSVSAFTLVIAPEHDQLAGPNVLQSTGALNRITPETVRQAGRAWQRLADYRGPRLAVLIGGPGKAARFTQKDRDQLLALLEKLGTRYRLLITPSRRTPEDLRLSLHEQFAAQHFVWDGSGDNPYPGILGLCNAVLVTADSVNMVSEAASTGLPVHIAPVTGLAPKLRRFHEGLKARGAVRPVELPLAVWRYPPLREADRIAAEAIHRLEW